MITKRWVVIGALLAGTLAMANSARAAGIAWRTDLKAALTEAGKDDRLVMINFMDKECTWCQRMDNETLANAEVSALVGKFIPVRIDAGEAPELVRQYSLRGVPAFIFIEGSGAEADRVEGFVPAPVFVERLNTVLSDQEKLVTLRKKVTAQPEDMDSKAELARIYVNRRQGDLAAPLVDALAALPKDKAPKDMAELLLGTGVAYGSRGNNDRALVYLSMVTKAYPDTEEADWAAFFTGLALGLKGDQKAAVAQLEKVAQGAKTEAVRDRARALLERFKEEPPVPTQ